LPCRSRQRRASDTRRTTRARCAPGQMARDGRIRPGRTYIGDGEYDLARAACSYVLQAGTVPRSSCVRRAARDARRIRRADDCSSSATADIWSTVSVIRSGSAGQTLRSWCERSGVPLRCGY
jgi:hypothetical protein